VTVFTTGPFTPFSSKALLKAFRRVREEKSGGIATERTRISLWGFPVLSGFRSLALGLTRVYS
jgi:hypothetical protein